MAKKKSAASAPIAPASAAPSMPPGAMPPGAMPGGGPMGMGGMGAGPLGGGGNPMLAMMQMMQMMMGNGAAPALMAPCAIPFAGQPVDDGDRGLDADIIRPAMFEDLIKEQEGVPVGSVLDLLPLTSHPPLCPPPARQPALGGIPKGCTIAFAGPPGRGKTRTSLAGLARVAQRGEKVAFVIAEEGFHDQEGNGRDDLCSRMVKIGMAATGLD